MNNGLPEGWVHVQLSQVCELNPAKPSRDTLPPEAEVTFVPMAAVDATSGTITEPQRRSFGDVRKSYTAFAEGDVILAKITPCFENGKAAVARGLRNGLGFGSSEFHVLRSSDAILPEYTFHYLRQPRFREEAVRHMTGTAGQARVPADYLKSIEFSLPPLAEQKRIVEQVETLLAQVNILRGRLGKIPVILKRFRQAVLAAACTGKLTEDWRDAGRGEEAEAALVRLLEKRLAEYQANCARAHAAGHRKPPRPRNLQRIPVGGALGELPSEWTVTAFNDVCDDITVGHVGPMAHEYVRHGVPFLRSLNVRPFRFDPSDLKYVSPSFHARLRKSALRPGDVVVIRSGNAGVACVVPTELEEANCADLVIVRPSAMLNPHYAAIFVNSAAAREYVEAAQVGIAQQHFNIGSMRLTPLPLPPYQEQCEIVRRVHALFSLADAIEQRVVAVAVRVEKLPQTILAKAFSGQLVPTEAELARRGARPGASE